MIDTALVREAWLAAHPGEGRAFDNWLNSVMHDSYIQGRDDGYDEIATGW